MGGDEPGVSLVLCRLGLICFYRPSPQVHGRGDVFKARGPWGGLPKGPVSPEAHVQGPPPETPSWAVPTGPHPGARQPCAQRSWHPSQSVAAKLCGFGDRSCLLGVLRCKSE